MGEVLSFRADAPSTESSVTFATFQSETNATAVRIEPGEDARVLLPFLDRLVLVEVSFPGFGDGRGYSSARILREAGYVGELRAVGDVLVDQLLAMRRCGFDSILPNKALDPAVMQTTLERYEDVYQKSVAGPAPIWSLRHGTQSNG